MNLFLELFRHHHWFEIIGVHHALLIILVGYFYLNYFKRNPHTKNASLKKQLFITGLCLYYFASATPLHILSEHIFSVKMVKASIVYFVVPPCLLAGIPAEMLRPIIWNYRIRQTLYILTKPILSTIIFYVLFFLYLNPNLFHFINEGWLLDELSHVTLFCFSLFMWWSIITPLKELNYLSDLYRLANLLINGCILFGITYPFFLWDEPYKQFQDFPFPTYYSQNDDVIIGAAAILFVQKLLIIVIAGVIFYKRFKQENVIDPVNVSGLMGVKDPK
ncbi:cytochrome c oxidase assembly protein [Bacillus solimangrovi]|uniref:Cytochrome c oxidase assembly factor CtaG n=1 Tax=Bacillus solimangrovi TaxID=1305675 RepID=A0A1E5LF84_9BACI|nr:cytochrome c oxidase assembly protein [Bacillus solimangrovi]OEH92716.1 hypothetical protein BFG57_01550 [Bacillus solimangrovi]